MTTIWMGRNRFGNSMFLTPFDNPYRVLIYNSCTGYSRCSLLGLIHWRYKSASTAPTSATVPEFVPQVKLQQLVFTNRNWCGSQNGSLQKHPVMRLLQSFIQSSCYIYWIHWEHTIFHQRGLKNLRFLCHWNPKTSGTGDATALHCGFGTWRWA